MPRDPRILVFVGIKNAVVALDEKTGYEIWRTEVRAAGFVYVVWDGATRTKVGEFFGSPWCMHYV